MTDYFKAVHSLVGGNIQGPTNGPISDYFFSDGQTPPTEKEIQAKLAELQADFDVKQYQRDRLKEYPSIQELVVALYDEKDKAEIDKKRAEIKKKFPKPE